MLGTVMTLANSIIGVGILAMPFCFQKCGILLSIVLLVISNWITQICCHYLIKSSLLTRRKSYEFLGFHAFGSSGKLLVELCIIGYLLGTCITYFVVVGDLGPQIITKMFSLDDSYIHLRSFFMFVITLACVLPLGMLKNVDSLSAVCTASIGFYICLVIKIILESKTHIAASDWKDKVVYWRPAGILQCLPIFSMALSCQMQLFEVFKSINNQSVEKLNGIVRHATWICTFVYIAVGFFGYVAFCTQSFSGNILMNFSQSFGSDVIKIGFILSLAFSFPLVIFPCRASIYSLLYRKGHTDASAGGYIPETRFKTITTFIVGFALCVALMIPSVELIIGLVGSTIGVAICVMFPAACFRKVSKKSTTNDRSFALSGVVLLSGFCLMVLGTYANLQAIDEHSSGAHLESDIIQKLLTTPKNLPIIHEKKIEFLEKKFEKAENKFSKNELNPNPNLLQEPIKKVDNLSGPSLTLSESLDDINKPLLQGPVLPVEEVRNDIQPKQEMKQDAMPANKIFKKIESGSSNFVANEKKEIVDNVIAKEEKPLQQPSISKNSSNIEIIKIHKNVTKEPSSLQQTIDKDAIKKDEEIAAEELKSNKANKAAVDELKKTQNELKKTKELLERKVDEIKEELAKQNKETQDLVVEKLVEVVEKVEKIEREVQKNEDENKKNLQNLNLTIPKVELPPKIPEPSKKMPGLIQKLTEATLDENKLEKKVKAEAAEAAKVYEPLSYKTGELIEQQARNGNDLKQLLPLPLAVLVNSSKIKKNIETPAAAEPVPVQVPVVDKQPIQDLFVSNSNLPEKPASADNVEAIRRDILQLNTNEPIVTTMKPQIIDLGNSHQRIRRELEHAKSDFQSIDAKLSKENCLTEPKLESLLHHGNSGALDFKMQAIGRDLKSLALQNKKNDQS